MGREPHRRAIKIAPSMLSANFARLPQQIRALEQGGADWLHLDVMDGHFVPNITFGPVVIKSIRAISTLPLDAHLMIANPDRYIEAFRDAGCDRVTVHVETCPRLRRTVRRIKQLGMKAGITLNPKTPASAIESVIPEADLVLVMTVHPGFGGQKFIASMIPKIERIASMIATHRRPIELEVDGGVDEGNARRIVEAGATVLVAGHAIFSKPHLSRAVKALRRSTLW